MWCNIWLNIFSIFIKRFVDRRFTLSKDWRKSSRFFTSRGLQNAQTSTFRWKIVSDYTRAHFFPTVGKWIRTLGYDHRFKLHQTAALQRGSYSNTRSSHYLTFAFHYLRKINFVYIFFMKVWSHESLLEWKTWRSTFIFRAAQNHESDGRQKRGKIYAVLKQFSVVIPLLLLDLS